MDNPIFKKIHFGSFLLLAFSPLINAKFIPITIALWLLTNIIFGIKNQKSNGWKSIKHLLIQSSLFIVILIWTLLIDRSKDAYFYLERSLSLLIFPLGFYFNPINFNHKQLNIIKISFAGSSIFIVFISSLIAILSLIQKIGDANWYTSTTELFNADNFHYHYRTAFENVSDFHPTYASMYLGLSFIFILNLLINHFYEISIKRKLIAYTSLFAIITLMAALASRTPFAATIVVAIFLLFIKLKKKIYAFYGVCIAVGFSIILYLTVPSFSARFSQISFNNTELPANNGNTDSFNLRTGILHCSLSLIKDHWIFGVGPGKTQTYLNKCYMEIAPEIYKGKEFNTHNQFTSYWAGMGLFGLFSFLFILIATAYKGIKNKEYLPFFVVVFLSLCFQTENIMVRQQGIVIVAFFINLFYFVNCQTKHAI